MLSNRNWQVRPRAWVAIAMLLTLGGCSGGGATAAPDAGPDGGGAVVVEAIELEVGPAGGTVELANRARVEIPPGALDAPVRIRIEELERSSIAASPDRTRDLGRTVSFKPEGTQFNQPVRIRLETEDVPERVRVYRLEDDQATRWRMVPNETKSAGRVEVDVTGFSVYAAFRPDMDCGSLDYDDDGTADFCDVCDVGDDGQDGDGDGVPDACDACLVLDHQDGAFQGECVFDSYATADTYVDSAFPSANFGTSALLGIRGDVANQYAHLRWDLASIPFGATVSSAQMFLFHATGVPDTMDVELHSQVCCWDELTTTQMMGPTVGTGVLQAEVSDTVVAQGYMLANSESVRAYVESSAGGEADFTLMTAGAPLEFHSREASTISNRPWLSVTHEPYVEVIRPALEDAMVDPQQPTVNFGDAETMIAGANGAVDTDVRYVFMKFDVSGLTTQGQIFEVALEMNSVDGFTYGGGSGGVIAAVVSDDTLWSEATLTWSNQPAVDAMSSFPLWAISEPDLGPAHRSHWGGFVTSNVISQASLDGVLTLRLEISDSFHEYASSEAALQALAPQLRILRTDDPP